FFQAEDGIRDFHVTGVQTCALPIYPLEIRDRRGTPALLVPKVSEVNGVPRVHLVSPDHKVRRETEAPKGRLPSPSASRISERPRSEERRVGKDGRTRRAACEGEGSR